MSQAEPPNSSVDSDAKSTVNEWLVEHGDAIYAYAVGRVESREVADDLVQETFLSALKNFSQFQGRSSPKTWLVAILRNKIIGHYRTRSRQREREQALGDEASGGPIFDDKGIWKNALGKWPQRPDAGFENQEFWSTLTNCLKKLPASCADVFMLRVIDEMDSKKVCKTLAITSTNMSVRLHRARISLRECLERNWFGERD